MAKKISYHEDDEDNIVIANMNVEGMPWYKEEKRELPVAEHPDMPDKKETFYIILGALKAGMLIVGVFAVALILFTLFCTKVWFSQDAEEKVNYCLKDFSHTVFSSVAEFYVKKYAILYLQVENNMLKY